MAIKKITGRVTHVQARMGKPPKNVPYYEISVLGDSDETLSMTTFSKEVAEGLNKGQEYEFACETAGRQGQYLNLSGAPTPITRGDEEQDQEPERIPVEDHGAEIRRGGVIKAAAAITAALIEAGIIKTASEAVERTKEISEDLDKYVRLGLVEAPF